MFAVLVVMPVVGSAQIALVHVTSCGSQIFPASTCAIPATGSGHLIAVAWSSVWGTTPTISGITDNAGNVYSEAGASRAVLATSAMIDFWYARNSKPNATTLTITPSPGGSTGGAVIWEFSNVDTLSPLDQTAVLSSQAATTAPSGASVTTTATSEVIISALTPAGSVNGIAPGNTFANDLTFFGNGWAHLISSSTGTFNAQWATTSGAYASSTVSFKAAATGSTGSFSSCDLNQDSSVNVIDVQLATNMYLGVLPCNPNISGGCSASVVQQVQNAALGGTCALGGHHSVTLNWTLSTTPNVSYVVYRSAASGGPYTKLASTALNTASYVDNGIAAGQTYYYVTTAVDGSGNESVVSNEASAVIPFP
jgi:hypothetical protein